MFALYPHQPVVHTPVFDGPLDLLLYLIRRDGVEVRDLPIAHITREYLQYLEIMEEMDLGVAGEFLVMASTLCQLKSREILPRDPEILDEEEEDPKNRLIRRLIEYQRFKEASEDLLERPWVGRDHFLRSEATVDSEDRPLERNVDSFALLETFYELLREHDKGEPVHEVAFEEYSFSDRVSWLLERLEGQSLTLTALMREIDGRPQKVLTFLALLEMCRQQMLSLSQDNHLGELQIEGLITSEEADLSRIEAIGMEAG